MAPKENKDAKDPQTQDVVVDKWDGSAVKNALDDAVKEVFIKKFNHVENFALIDGRLAMCGVAVLAALFALVWDHFYPFPQSKPVLIFCFTTYFAISGALSLYLTYKEKGIFVVTIHRDPSGFHPDNVWEASSTLKKYDDKYKCHLAYLDGKTGKRREGSFKKSIANFIDVNGIVLYDLVEHEVTKLHNSLMQERKDK